MTKQIEALKLALEALERCGSESYTIEREAIAALREALAEPTSADYAMGYAEGFNDACKPAQRTWVGLTDEEAMQICVDCGCLSEDWLTLLDATEAKLKEKNT